MRVLAIFVLLHVKVSCLLALILKVAAPKHKMNEKFFSLKILCSGGRVRGGEKNSNLVRSRTSCAGHLGCVGVH
jgi:hypothetical protein